MGTEQLMDRRTRAPPLPSKAMEQLGRRHGIQLAKIRIQFTLGSTCQADQAAGQPKPKPVDLRASYHRFLKGHFSKKKEQGLITSMKEATEAWMGPSVRAQLMATRTGEQI